MEYIIIKIEIYMMENIKIIKKKEKEQSFIIMEINILVNEKMI